MWDWKRSFEALFLLKVAVLLSGEGKAHVQCDQLLFLLICGRMSGYKRAQAAGMLWSALRVPSCLTTAHFPARNKSHVSPCFLTPKYVKVGGNEAACLLTGKRRSRLQAGVRCSWCSTFARVPVTVDQVMGSAGLQWCLEVQPLCY